MPWHDIAAGVLAGGTYLSGYLLGRWAGHHASYQRGFNGGWAECERQWSAKTQPIPRLFQMPAGWQDEVSS